LHLGSLYAALASFLHARANNGQWLLRIDDIDTPREAQGAADNIITTLDIFGLHWDGEIYYQSKHLDSYQSIISDLKHNNHIYPCNCSRKSLLLSPVYPQTCRYSEKAITPPYSLRIKSKALDINYSDELQGCRQHNFAQQFGDFIIKRKDNITAYQLAVVIDDHMQNITHVVRGFDLLDSTPKQIFLQQVLGYATPHYCHIPIIVDKQGQKLSKQSFAQAISIDTPSKTLFTLLTLLKQKPPLQLQNASISEIIDWAITNWQPQALKKIRAIN